MQAKMTSKRGGYLSGLNRLLKSKYVAPAGKQEAVAGLIKGKASVFAITKGVAHEFGTGHVPSRPFMAQSVPIAKDKIQALSEHFTDVKSYLIFCGVALHQSIVESIGNQNFTPLKPSTVKRKGSSVILVDTGDMLGSISSETRSRK